MLNNGNEKALSQETIKETFHKVLHNIRQTISTMASGQPKIGNPDLTYQRCTDTDWVNSFWDGQLWLSYGYTSDKTFLKACLAQQPYFAGRLDRPETLDHDLGFLYSLSTVAEFKLTGDAEARKLSLRAADLLLTRFNPRGNYLQAWNISPEHTSEEQDYRRGQMIVDCMENLGLLYWASEQTGETLYRDIAVAHARTAQQFLVRPDGSTYHTFIFNPDTGAPLGGRTAQGYADESHWSRGQAWAIHGFTLSYERTGLAEFLQTATRLADYVVTRLGATGSAEDAVPFWDYELPAEGQWYKDSSAGAITAAGLLYLAGLLQQPEIADEPRSERYRNLAGRILSELIRSYTTFEFPGAEGLLLHGASHVPQGYTDNMLPYGDYFFVEALLRALGHTGFFW